jgi:hypothetical protein
MRRPQARSADHVDVDPNRARAQKKIGHRRASEGATADERFVFLGIDVGDLHAQQEQIMHIVQPRLAPAQKLRGPQSAPGKYRA